MILHWWENKALLSWFPGRKREGRKGKSDVKSFPLSLSAAFASIQPVFFVPWSVVGVAAAEHVFAKPASSVTSFPNLPLQISPSSRHVCFTQFHLPSYLFFHWFPLCAGSFPCMVLALLNLHILPSFSWMNIFSLSFFPPFLPPSPGSVVVQVSDFNLV